MTKASVKYQCLQCKSKKFVLGEAKSNSNMTKKSLKCSNFVLKNSCYLIITLTCLNGVESNSKIKTFMHVFPCFHGFIKHENVDAIATNK